MRGAFKGKPVADAMKEDLVWVVHDGTLLNWALCG